MKFMQEISIQCNLRKNAFSSIRDGILVTGSNDETVALHSLDGEGDIRGKLLVLKVGEKINQCIQV